jgi:hypothetical protein
MIRPLENPGIDRLVISDPEYSKVIDTIDKGRRAEHSHCRRARGGSDVEGAERAVLEDLLETGMLKRLYCSRAVAERPR